MSRVDGIPDHPSVPTGGQQPLLEYRRTPQQTALVDNVMLQDNTTQVGILPSSSVSHVIVGSHSLLQSGTINHQPVLDRNPATQNALGNAEQTDNRVAVTVTQGLPCASQVLGKNMVLEGVVQLNEKQRQQEDLEKLRVNENLLKLGENEDLLKLRQHEELMKLREHEELLKKQRSKKVRTTSKYFSRTDRLLKHRRMCRENQGKAPDKNPAVKTEPIILAISTEHRLLSPQKDVINPTTKKIKTTEKLELETSNKEETGSPTGVSLNKRDCIEYYTSNLKVKDEYKVEQSSLVNAHPSHGSEHLGETYQHLNPPKLVLKKISSNKNQKTTEQLNQILPVTTNFDATKVTKYTYAMGSNPSLLVIEGQTTDQVHDASRKAGGGHSNYDDAMQFVKKKRFLQGPNNTNREFAVSVGQIVSQPAVTQAAPTTVGESSGGTSMLVQPSNTELKSGQDKGGIPDEVLQTLLDHYTNKANGQVPFSVSDTQVASNITVSSTDNSNVPPLEQVSESSQPPSADNCNMLHEYSKFLQQALERTCHNDSYSGEQGLAYETESQPLTGSLQVPPLFSSLERQVFATMVTQHGFRPEAGSSVRLPTQKAQYSLLVGESQHPFAFMPTVTSTNSISSPPDFIEQVNSQKKREEPSAHSNHQMGTFGQDSRFSATGGEMTPSFNDSASGQVNLRARQGNSNYSEFSLVNVPEGRDQMSASPAVTGGQTFR
ncbi:rac GTPase-activating protein 1 isoform X4 [Rhinoraja longicauda]